MKRRERRRVKWKEKKEREGPPPATTEAPKPPTRTADDYNWGSGLPAINFLVHFLLRRTDTERHKSSCPDPGLASERIPGRAASNCCAAAVTAAAADVRGPHCTKHGQHGTTSNESAPSNLGRLSPKISFLSYTKHAKETFKCLDSMNSSRLKI